ncbi:M56 family metallopeptidase [uncultured Lacinutrix sp.]|uniref:M56 family metallopeptidase n=1 Tax=uncultured Lacinutrix sp. TaxID=574032 RepID=UPI0026252D73|nr:M56 family metallopeptidase [uncultured Lacinutrix sp.]
MDYLLKANAIIILFYLCYKLFLQKETFFESNRYFLLAGIAAASITPFIVIPIYIEKNLNTNFNIESIQTITQTETIETFSFLNAITWVYFIGVGLFTIKFLIELISLLNIIIKNKREKQGKYTFIETNKEHSPFSFFKFIVYNPEHFTVNELNHIILHEKIHAKQYHSIDILITKIATILFWFNPFIWLYNKSLKQNLEFIADEKTQNKVENSKTYQTLLLKTLVPKHQLVLVNNFYNSLIKKRIIMLHKSKSNKLNTWKYSLILPLLALF